VRRSHKRKVRKNHKFSRSFELMKSKNVPVQVKKELLRDYRSNNLRKVWCTLMLINPSSPTTQ
jgi:hypothetical protein